MSHRVTNQPRANKALVPTAGASLSAQLCVARTRLPVSTLTPAPAVGTAYSFAQTKIALPMFDSIRRLCGAQHRDSTSAILRHTQGATVTHAGPFAMLEVPVLPLEEVRPLYDSYVIPFYMKGLSQFGPTEEAAFQHIRTSVTDQLITTLLSDFNWRSRTAATYFAIILDRRQHLDHIGTLLLRSDVCYVGAAYCCYMAHLGTPEAADFLSRYLGYYLTRPDLYFDQADALAALRYIDSQSGSSHEAEQADALSSFLRRRPDFFTHVSMPGLSEDLSAAYRIRHST